MAVSLTIHNDFQLDVPFGRIQKQTDENHSEFIVIDDMDSAGIVQQSTKYLESTLFLKVFKDGTCLQVSQLPFALSVLAIHRDLDNLRVYLKDSQTFVETRIGMTPTSTAEYVFGSNDDEMFLEIDTANNTITTYA